MRRALLIPNNVQISAVNGMEIKFGLGSPNGKCHSSLLQNLILNAPAVNHSAMRSQFTPVSALFLSLYSRNSACLAVRLFSCRKFSSSQRVSRVVSPADFRETSVEIPIGGSGTIWLNVLQPITLQQSAPAKRPNVILYLPPGPLFPTQPSESVIQPARTRRSSYRDLFPSPQHALSSTTQSTVVTVNYRLGTEVVDGEEKSYYYPTPVHDTLAGFDWVFEKLKPDRLCVYGTHIGGSLAVMLALTEPRSVRAIAAHEPMCDWTSLDDYCLKTPPAPEEGTLAGSTSDDLENGSSEIPTDARDQPPPLRKRGRKRKTPTAPPDLIPLLRARRSLFLKPDNYFDSFASPVLFLRSSGKEYPKDFPDYHIGPDYPIPVLKTPPKEVLNDIDFTRYFNDLDLDLIPAPTPEELDIDRMVPEKPIRRRKALSRWPPYGLEYNDRPGAKSGGLWGSKPNLPHVRIFVHSNFPPEVGDEVPSLPPTEANEANGNVVPGYSTNGTYEPAEGEPETPDKTTPSQEVPNEAVQSPPRPRRPRTQRIRSLEADGETVLARQGAEMVSLMRNACFWGREKGYGEKRVRVVTIPLENGDGFDNGTRPDDGDGAVEEGEVQGGNTLGDSGDEMLCVEEMAGRYFHEILERGRGK
ncbi:hypothetical protein FQN51_000940 [Onygenales sp. PD_10]|nr:hypothetical protein FQN51_000940 [Onygenales sp. PD_10]